MSGAQGPINFGQIVAQQLEGNKLLAAIEQALQGIKFNAAGSASFFAGGNTTVSSSATGALSALTFSAAGGASIGFSGASIIVSAASGGAGASQSFSVVGNTTGSTTSAAVPFAGYAVSGAGGASVGWSGSSLIVSAQLPAPQTNQTAAFSAISNTTGLTSSTTATITGLPFIGAGGVSVGFSQSSIIISGATTSAQSLQTATFEAIGNTTASSSATTATLTGLTFSGAGNVSVGYSGSSIVISGSSVNTGNLIAIGNTTGTTSSINTSLSQLTLWGQGGVSVGFSGSSIIISGATGGGAGVSTANLLATGNTTGSTSSLNTSISQLTLSGSGGVSIGFSGSSIVIAGATTAAQTNQTANFDAVGNTTGTTSSFNTVLTQLTLSGAGGVSVGFNGSSIIISGATTAAQTNQTANFQAVGNTTGSTSSFNTVLTQLTLSGSGGVSVGYSGSSIVIAGATTAAQTLQTANFDAVGNTTGTTSSFNTVLTQLTLSGAGGVSVGFNASNIIISGPPAQTNQTANFDAVGNTTGTTSSFNTVLTQLTLSGAGGVSVGFNASSIIISGPPAQTNQTANFQAVGNTTGSTSSFNTVLTQLTLSGSGGVSVGYSGSTIVIAGATTAVQTNQTANFQAVGNTTGSTSSFNTVLTQLTLSGSGGVSVGYSGSSIIIAGATTAAQTLQTATFQAIGNTTASSSATTATLTGITLSGAGGVSVGYSGSSIVISGATTAAQSIQTANFTALGNTTGSTSSTTASVNGLTFSGQGGVSVGFSGQSIQISGNQTASWFVSGGTDPNLATSSTTMPTSNFAVVGYQGVMVGYSANSALAIGAQRKFFLEPRPLVSATTTAALPGNGATMQLAPLENDVFMYFSQVRVLASFTLSIMTSATAVGTASATASAGSTLSAVLYSNQFAGAASGNNAYTSWLSTQMNFGMSQTISRSGASQTQSLIFSWQNGSQGGVSSTLTTASNTTTTPAATTNFNSWLEIDIPLGQNGTSTMVPGIYILGLQGATASAGASAVVWSGSFLNIAVPTVTPKGIGGGATSFYPGMLNVSTTAGAIVSSFDWRTAGTSTSQYLYNQWIFA